MKKCELCNSMARMYCESDQASLCWDCDARVHSANFLVTKHSRNLLCHACQALTPWTGSGPKLAPTVSVCQACVSRNPNSVHGDHPDRDSNAEDDSRDDEDDDNDTDEDDGDNQVVPLSATTLPPPMASSSSSSEESSSTSVQGRERASSSNTGFFSSRRTQNARFSYNGSERNQGNGGPGPKVSSWTWR